MIEINIINALIAFSLLILSIYVVGETWGGSLSKYMNYALSISFIVALILGCNAYMILPNSVFIKEMAKYWLITTPVILLAFTVYRLKRQ